MNSNFCCGSLKYSKGTLRLDTPKNDPVYPCHCKAGPGHCFWRFVPSIFFCDVHDGPTSGMLRTLPV